MINVIGLGYIGLPTALMLASHGQEVVGTDINASLVAMRINAMLPPEEIPAKTEGYEGFYHLIFINGTDSTTRSKSSIAITFVTTLRSLCFLMIENTRFTIITE